MREKQEDKKKEVPSVISVIRRMGFVLFLSAYVQQAASHLVIPITASYTHTHTHSKTHDD